MEHLFGKSEYSQETNEASLVMLLDRVLSKNPQAVMLLCCDNDLESRDFFEPILSSMTIPIFGGIFPAIIVNEEVKEQGILVVPVHTSVELKIYQGLEHAPANQFDFSFSLPSCQSAMILIDGLSRNIDFALNQLFQQFGQTLNVFGGGAGSLSFEQKPCLFSNQGILSDAMVVVFMQQPWELAIGHGWEILEGPFLANEVDDNRIIQLNFQPALDVYQKVVEQFDGRQFSEYDFFELAKAYPFGLERLDDDLLVRDPVTVEQDSLVCVGKVPENTMLYILKGQNANLITAAVDAVKHVVKKNGSDQGLLFDCISRQLFLEDEFAQELQGVSSALGRSELIGALVLGEIASGISGAIHFHNKTAVTAVAGNV